MDSVLKVRNKDSNTIMVTFANIFQLFSVYWVANMWYILRIVYDKVVNILTVIMG